MGPTKATLNAVGKISWRVARFNGTRNGVMPGIFPVGGPSSATFGTTRWASPAPTARHSNYFTRLVAYFRHNSGIIRV
jgi:hypothetical protein